MKRKLYSALALVLILMMIPLSSLAATVKLAYKGGALNIRAGAGTEYASVGTVHHGDSITVLSSGSVWSKIKTSGGKVGYIKNLYISNGNNNYASGTSYFDGGITGYVTSTVNFRAGASTSTKSMGTLSRGTKVTVLGKNGDFYLVKNSKGTQGFVHKNYLSKTKPSGSSSSSSATKTAKVTASSLRVRCGAGSEYAVIGTLSKGTKVTIVSKGSKWTQIRVGNLVGYVASNYIK